MPINLHTALKTQQTAVEWLEHTRQQKWKVYIFSKRNRCNFAYLTYPDVNLFHEQEVVERT
jgi:hypothetical protein